MACEQARPPKPRALLGHPGTSPAGALISGLLEGAAARTGAAAQAALHFTESWGVEQRDAADEVHAASGHSASPWPSQLIPVLCGPDSKEPWSLSRLGAVPARAASRCCFSRLFRPRQKRGPPPQGAMEASGPQGLPGDCANAAWGGRESLSMSSARRRGQWPAWCPGRAAALLRAPRRSSACMAGAALATSRSMRRRRDRRGRGVPRAGWVAGVATRGQDAWGAGRETMRAAQQPDAADEVGASAAGWRGPRS